MEGPGVGVTLGIGVRVGVRVMVGVTEGTLVGVTVTVGVGVRVGVGVLVTLTSKQAHLTDIADGNDHAEQQSEYVLHVAAPPEQLELK